MPDLRLQRGVESSNGYGAVPSRPTTLGETHLQGVPATVDNSASLERALLNSEKLSCAVVRDSRSPSCSLSSPFCCSFRRWLLPYLAQESHPTRRVPAL